MVPLRKSNFFGHGKLGKGHGEVIGEKVCVYILKGNATVKRRVAASDHFKDFYIAVCSMVILPINLMED